MPFNIAYYEPAPLDPRAEQIMVPMRDGVRLATDVYLPDRPGRVPAVLVRLPYDKCGRYTFMPELSPHFTERGYAFVVQDVRGKFRSEGETMPFAHEIEDGYDTLEWMCRRPWSNESVGMWGESYYGYTQWAAVASGHPSLKAIVPGMTSVNLLDTSCWRSAHVPELYLVDYLAHFWLDNMAYDFAVDWSQRPLAGAFDEAYGQLGRRCAAIDRYILGAERAPSIYPPGRHPFDHLKIPTLHKVGWFDNILPGAMRDFTELSRRPSTAPLQYLVAEAVDHENYHLSQYPLGPEDDHEKDDAALKERLPEMTRDALDFFDRVLMERGRLADMMRVRWFLGHDDWHAADSWPPEGVREMNLYLSSLARSLSGPSGGALTEEAETSGGRVSWVHDPADLVPSALQDPFSQIKEWPDERRIELRPDVLTFTSEPFRHHVDLVGPMTASLRLGSSADSMHIFVKLLDVAPDDSARAFARGQARVVRPQPEQQARIDLSHTGYRLQAGHALRVHISSSDFPLYLPHPGPEEDPWYATAFVQNRQSLVTGGSLPSHVSLTVFEAK